MPRISVYSNSFACTTYATSSHALGYPFARYAPTAIYRNAIITCSDLGDQPWDSGFDDGEIPKENEFE
jgi:hypothetical protein